MLILILSYSFSRPWCRPYWPFRPKWTFLYASTWTTGTVSNRTLWRRHLLTYLFKSSFQVSFLYQSLNDKLFFKKPFSVWYAGSWRVSQSSGIVSSFSIQLAHSRHWWHSRLVYWLAPPRHSWRYFLPIILNISNFIKKGRHFHGPGRLCAAVTVRRILC